MAPSKHRLTVFLLRFLISKSEYERLECILSPYTPESLRPHLPSTADFDQRPRSPSKDITVAEAAIGTRDEFLPATVRQGTKVFAGTYVVATLVDVVLIGIIKKHGYPHAHPQPSTHYFKLLMKVVKQFYEIWPINDLCAPHWLLPSPYPCTELFCEYFHFENLNFSLCRRRLSLVLWQDLHWRFIQRIHDASPSPSTFSRGHWSFAITSWMIKGFYPERNHGGLEVG